MKKSALLLLLLFPLLSFSQVLTGKWTMKDDQAKMVEFKADGTMAFTDPDAPAELASIDIRYAQTEENGVKYLVCDMYMEGEKLETQKNIYKVEGDTLTIFEDPTDEDFDPNAPTETVLMRVKQ